MMYPKFEGLYSALPRHSPRPALRAPRPLEGWGAAAAFIRERDSVGTPLPSRGGAGVGSGLGFAAWIVQELSLLTILKDIILNTLLKKL